MSDSQPTSRSSDVVAALEVHGDGINIASGRHSAIVLIGNKVTAGKGNAAAMHTLDLCLEEYIEYLMEHPHIAVFEDGVLRYEIYRQNVGDADPITLELTGKTANYDSSLDNMGGVITVFTY